jgi:uncharacterized membrane protein
MMNWNSHMTSGGWILSILAAAIVLSLVIAAGVWIARELRNRRNDDGGPSALEILDRASRAAKSTPISTSNYVARSRRRRLSSHTRPEPRSMSEPNPRGNDGVVHGLLT